MRISFTAAVFAPAVLAAAILSPAHAAAERHPLQPSDIYDVSMVSDVEVSPDGHHILFTRATFDVGTDKRVTELWLAQVDDAGKLIDKRLLVGRDYGGGASFSPDGSRVAYIGSRLGKSQIFILTLADGVPKPLTSGKFSPGSFRWSPDGVRIAFVGRVEATPAKIPGLPAKPEGAERAADPKIISDLFWRADGEGEIPAGASQLFVVDVNDGKTLQLTKGDTDQIDGSGLAWSPDNRYIIGSVSPDPINTPGESDLWRFDSQSADAKPVRLTTRAGSEANPEISPDGRTIAFLGAEATKQFYPMPELWTMAATPGAPVRKLSAGLDRPVTSILWNSDSRSLFGLYNDRGVTRVGEFDAASGAAQIRVPIVGGTRLYLPSSGGSFSSHGGTFAYTSAFADRPAGLAISKGGTETASVDFNTEWAARRIPSRIEEVTVASRADGLPVQGWIAFPPDFDPAKKYPLILDIHGGPNTDYGPFFSFTHGLYAAAGYIVLFTNPRGSIGYGSAFANAITDAYPGQDHDDLMTAVDAVAKRRYVDQRNLFIGGGSGGGVLTLWAIGKEPGKFRAAAALRPVVDWTDQATTSDGTAFFMHQWMGAKPWEQPDLYFRRSPFSLAGNIRTPTLLITGEQDYRTPISQTEQMFGALKLRGVETTMMRLPGAGHGMGRPSQWLQSILAPIDFFDRHKEK